MMCFSGMGTLVVPRVVLLAVCFHLVTAYISLDEGPPMEIFANVSDTVTLTCDLRDVGNSRIRWFHYETDRFLSFNRDILADLPVGLAERLEIVGDASLEQFNLRIKNFRLSDLGRYSCFYMYPAMLNKQIASTTLTLYVPVADSPVCVVEPANGKGVDDVVVGDQVTLRCVIAVIKDPSPLTLIEYRRGDSKIALSSSTTDQLAFQRQLVPQDNGVDFTCTLTSPGLDGPRSCSVRPLEIIPMVRVTPPSLTIDKGSDASLVCEASGIPDIVSYRWEVRVTATGEKLPLGGDTLTQGVHVLAVSSVMEDITATCIVTNSNGLSSNSSAYILVIETNVPPPTTGAETDSTTTVANIETTLTPSSSAPSTSATATPDSVPVPAISTVPSETTNTSHRFVTNQPIAGAFPIIVIISAALVTVAVTVLVVVLICYCCVWKRKKSPTVSARYTMVELGANYEDVQPSPADNALVDQRGGTYQEVPATMSAVPPEQHGNTYQEVRPSSTDATTSVVERGNTYQEIPPRAPVAVGAATSTAAPALPSANAAAGTPLYAVPKKPKRGTPRNLQPDGQTVVRSAVVPNYATPKKPRPIGLKRRPSPSSRKPAPMPQNHIPKDTTLYAQPRKLSKRIKNRFRWGIDKNGYRIAESEDPRKNKAPEQGIVYADVEIGPAGVVTVDNPKPKTPGEQTLYAHIT